VLPIHRKNSLTGRMELVEKDELFADQVGRIPGGAFRVGSYTIGYTRDVDLFRYVETGIGANFSAYSLPSVIRPYYGDHPAGGNIFIRFRLRRPES
jgi:hypothetical protein